MKLLIEIEESRRSEKEKECYGKVYIHSYLTSRDYSILNSRTTSVVEEVTDNPFTQALETARLVELSKKIEKMVKEYYDSEADNLRILRKSE